MAGSPGGKNVGRLSLKVLPDTSDFLEELKAFAERVEKEVRIELEVNLDIESAAEELRSLQARLEAADLKVDIATEVDGAGALAHLDIILAAMQGTASANPINIDLDIDGQATEAITQATGQAAANASRMGTQIALWGPLIFIAAAGIAALAPALLVVFPLMAGLALGIGAIALGFDELKGVFKPVVAGFKEMRAEIGQTLTAGLKPLIAEFVTGFMPVLKDGLMVGAQLMNTLLTSVLEFLNSTTGLSLMSELFAGLGPALTPLMQAMGPLVELFVRLSVAALPGLQMMSEAILRVITNLNGWLAGNSIADDISTSMSQLGDVLSIIGNLTKDLFGPLVASAPAVIALLDGVGSTIGNLFQTMQPLFTFMSNHTGTMKALGAALTVVAIVMGTVAAATVVYGAVVSTVGSLMTLWAARTKIAAAAQWLLNAAMSANPIGLVVIAIVALVAGLVYAYTHFEGFRNVVNTVFTFIKNIVTTVVGFVLEHWRFFAAALLTIFTGPIGLLIALVVSNFGNIRDFVVGVFNGVMSFLSGVWDKIVSIFTGGVNAAKTVVSTVMSAIRAVIDLHISAALGVVRGISSVGSYFTSAFNTAKNAVTNTIDKIRSELSGLPGKALGWLGDVGGTLVGAGKKLIQGFIDGIASMFNAVKGKLGDLTSKLTSWKGPESLDKVILFGAGQLVIGGFIDGLESQYSDVESSLGNFTNGLSDLVQFDGEAALKFSGASGVLPQLDALLALDGGTQASRIIIENWETGMGHMRDISEEAVAGYEAATTAKTPPREDMP